VFDAGPLPLGRDHPLRRFWKRARGFWHGPTARLGWCLIAECLSSANRVGNLLTAFDRLEATEHSRG